MRLCTDEELGYLRSRTRFTAGDGLLLDDSYRLAHLPLVAPDHPKVISSREGAYYDRGRHPRVHAVVLPISWEALAAAAPFQDLDREIRSSLFFDKIAWHVMKQRREKLHATLCNGLALGESEPPKLSTEQQSALEAIGPVQAEVRGLFSGNINVGRLYLRVYPEWRDGENVFRRIQRILGRPETDLYVIGFYNLTDDLTPAEALALADIIDRWWDRPLLRLNVTHLSMLWGEDDLVLKGELSQRVALKADRSRKGIS